MFKKYFKPFLKKSIIVHYIIVKLIYLYLKFVYITSKWEIIWINPSFEHEIKNIGSALFALWHNRTAYGMHIFKKYDNVFALASTHTDGKIITSVIRAMNFGIIEGSTNRNPTKAVRAIIDSLKRGNKIVITPDGPRGPIYKINSSITKIAYKYNKPLIPISCGTTKFFALNSWDKMMLPKPFGKIIVTIGSPIILTGHEEADNKLLEDELMNLSYQAEKLI